MKEILIKITMFDEYEEDDIEGVISDIKGGSMVYAVEVLSK